MEFRRPSPQEEKLISLLVSRASMANMPVGLPENLLVQPMEDGSMGSLRLFPNGRNEEGRLLWRQVSEYQFTDIDGVQVIASLNVDQYGRLFELDIWKTNFEPLINIPENL